MYDFTPDNANTNLFKIKQEITGKIGDKGGKDVEIMVPLKYASKFWITLEKLLINCEINLERLLMWQIKS